MIDPLDLDDAPPPAHLPPLREVIARHGLMARKNLGQNFLLDLNLTGRIARAAGDLAQTPVLEIGPGPGGLTRALLAQGAQNLIVVEKDPRCLPALEEISAVYPGRLTIIAADALTLDEGTLAPGPVKIVANLPYNVGTLLLLKWCKTPQRFVSLTLLYQKEVAMRLASPPRSKDYGRLSVLVQWLFHVKPLFQIPPQAFTPPPKVTSMLVQLTPRAEPLAPADRAALEAVTAAAFGQRRKMLRAALRSLTPQSEALLAQAGISPERRAEELTVEEFCALARAWASIAPRADL